MPLTFEEPNKEQNGASIKNSIDEKVKVLNGFEKTQMTFITNAGQINSKVKYYVRGKNFGFFFTQKEAVLSFIKGMSKDVNKNTKEEESPIGIALKLQFVGANRKVKIEGHVEGTGKINYFKGKNPKKWYTDLPIYEKIIYKELWKGIDLVFYGLQNQLKYEFVVHPKGNLKDIKLRYKGSEDISLDEEGNLLIKNKVGNLKDEHPISYQEIEGEKVPIASKFKVNHHIFRKNTFGFEIEEGYDTNHSIIIDPGLIYSTYLGGSSGDFGTSIAIDSVGNAYVTGNTQSADFPTTAGAFQPAFAGGINDAFITKLNSDGTGLIYSTYLGGTGNDFGLGIAVDSTGDVYVTGGTQSADFPTTAGAFQTALAGSTDVFVTKLNDTGSALIYSTYLGGSSSNSGLGIAVDSTSDAYVTGGTQSADFPTTAGAFQTAIAGNTDAFVTKLNDTGTALSYSTYLGGSGDDRGEGVAIDHTGNAYVTGVTRSPDFPTTPDAFQTTFNGSDDAFVTKLNADGTAQIYSTYLGGTDDDTGEGIAVDQNGHAYVSGFTSSTDFPTTTGVFQPAYGGGANDAFISKFNADGTALIYSTYLGGSDSDQSFGIAIDHSGNAYVTGETFSTDFPTTANAFQPTFAGGVSDAFITKLNPTASALIYSTYLGGDDEDRGNGIAVDNAGNAFVTGQTESTDFPTTPGAFQTTNAGFNDAFVTKVNTNTAFPDINVTNQNMTAIVYESDI